MSISVNQENFSFVGTSDTVFGPDTGKKCHFPFVYDSNNYTKCIENDSPGRPWCATEKEYAPQKFGYCNCPSRMLNLFIQIMFHFYILVFIGNSILKFNHSLQKKRMEKSTC